MRNLNVLGKDKTQFIHRSVYTSMSVSTYIDMCRNNKYFQVLHNEAKMEGIRMYVLHKHYRCCKRIYLHL